MNFFKKIKIKIFNFEKYKEFADEDVTKAIKYFFQIVMLFVICATMATTIPRVNLFYQGIGYIKDNIPNFNIKDERLVIESEEPILIENNDLSLVILINTNIIAEDEDKFFEQQNQYENVLVFTDSKLLLRIANTSGVMSYDYKSITETLNLNEISKQSLVEYFENSGYFQTNITIFLIMFAYLLFTYIIVTLIDVIIFSALALITSKLYRAGLNYKQCFNISIYALTLPIILNVIYVIVNAFTGFIIQYFQLMYYIIAYIYIIATILIIKTDFNKTGSDIIKITEEIKPKEEEEMHKESKDDESKEEKKKKNKEKEKDTPPEPDPGNA